MKTAAAFGRFLLVGGTGFGIDVGITMVLIGLTGNAWLARIPAIATAMFFTWMLNRSFTFSVKSRRTSREAVRYLAVALLMALGNYVVYGILLKLAVWPVAAIAIATAIQAVGSFYGYRRFVFGGAR